MGKALPSRKVPDNKAQDRNIIPNARPTQRAPKQSPTDYGCGPRTPPAPLDPVSNAARGADDRA